MFKSYISQFKVSGFFSSKNISFRLADEGLSKKDLGTRRRFTMEFWNKEVKKFSKKRYHHFFRNKKEYYQTHFDHFLRPNWNWTVCEPACFKHIFFPTSSWLSIENKSLDKVQVSATVEGWLTRLILSQHALHLD